jgi:cell division septation protein DedD
MNRTEDQEEEYNLVHLFDHYDIQLRAQNQNLTIQTDSITIEAQPEVNQESGSESSQSEEHEEYDAIDRSINRIVQDAIEHNQSTDQSADQSIDQSVDQSADQSADQSTNTSQESINRKAGKSIRLNFDKPSQDYLSQTAENGDDLDELGIESEPESEPDVNDYVEEDTMDGTEEEVSVVESQLHMSQLINGTQPHDEQTQSQTRTMSNSMTQSMTHTMNDSAGGENVTVMADDEMEETTQEVTTTTTESTTTTSHSPPEKRARPNDASDHRPEVRTGSHESNLPKSIEDEFEDEMESEPEIKSSLITFTKLLNELGIESEIEKKNRKKIHKFEKPKKGNGSSLIGIERIEQNIQTYSPEYIKITRFTIKNMPKTLFNLGIEIQEEKRILAKNHLKGELHDYLVRLEESGWCQKYQNFSTLIDFFRQKFPI